jgi:hypothetical protein
MAGTDGFLYNHDPVGDTFNDNGNPLTWTLTLAPVAKSEGMQNLLVEGIVWDFFSSPATSRQRSTPMTGSPIPAPMDTDTEVVPATQSGLTDYRVGGRYLGFTLTSSDLGNYMRMGKPVAFMRPSAKRR